jgi:hypothetical protein
LPAPELVADRGTSAFVRKSTFALPISSAVTALA